MYPNEAGVMDGLLCGDRPMPPAGVSLSRYGPSPRWVKIRMAWREAISAHYAGYAPVAGAAKLLKISTIFE